jgi:predicted dehydrogenase
MMASKSYISPIGTLNTPRPRSPRWALAKPSFAKSRFATTAKEGQAVLAVARSTRQLFMEALWTSFLPAYKRLQNLVQSGAFGKPTHLHFDFGYPTCAEGAPQLFAANGGGVLLDRSAYGTSLALRLFGQVEKIEAAIGVNNDGIDISAFLQLTHRTGGLSQLGFSLNSLLSNGATVACEAGMVSLVTATPGAETIAFQHMNSHRSPSMEGHGIVRQLRRYALVRRIKTALSVPKIEHHPYGVNPYIPQLRHFFNLLADECLESNVNTFESSLAALEIIAAAKSIR